MPEVDLDKFYKAAAVIVTVLMIPVQGWMLIHILKTDVERTEIKMEVESHLESPRHEGAIGAEVLNLKFKAMELDIVEIKGDLKEIKALVK